MRLHFLATGAVVGVVLSFGATALAHHGDAGRFEETITSLSGTVVALQLVNPHSTIILDIPDENGNTVRWQAELTGVNNLSRNGWTKDTLKPGDRILVSGRLIKSGAPYINLSENARVVRLETCEEIYRTRSDPVGPISCE